MIDDILPDIRDRVYLKSIQMEMKIEEKVVDSYKIHRQLFKFQQKAVFDSHELISSRMQEYEL